MFESLTEMVDAGRVAGIDDIDEAEKRVVKGIGKGLLKTISKMGISTIQSYCGAQIFEAVGLAPQLVDQHFTGTASRIGGISLGVLGREALERHGRGYPQVSNVERLLPVGGHYQWRRDGEVRQWSPDAIAKLQRAARENSWDSYAEFAAEMNDELAPATALRGLLDFNFPEGGGDTDRGGRAGGRAGQALLDRRDVARLALARGARDARDRDEPRRRALEHRRGRRGPGPLHRPRTTATRAARRSSRSPPGASA